ncbi:PIN domain-containing protein [Methylobacterium phyllosphaerae]
MVAVAIDTSVARGAGWKSAAFRSLLALAADGTIALYIPETVYQELRTQWRETYDDRLNQAKKAIRILRDIALLPASEGQALEAVDAELSKTCSSEDVSNTAFEELCKTCKIERLPITPEQAERVWKSYYNGEPPFGKVKQREDIPDAYIFESLRDLSNNRSGLLILCADGRLAKACASLEKVSIFKKIEDLMVCKEVKDAALETTIGKHWDAVKHKLLADVDQEVTEFVIENIENIIMWETVRDERIPSDSNDAEITMFGSADDIIIIERDEFTKGFFKYIVTFKSQCLLSFFVSKWEAYNVPDWVSVSHGDPEEEHYFEAEADREVLVTLTLALEVDLREDYEDESPILRDIQVVDKPELHLN